MMKILVALNNQEIKQKIDECFKEEVYHVDFESMEEVIEFLSTRSEEYILVTKDSLKGNIDKRLYIKQLKLANKNVKIIYIVQELTQEYKEFLFANEVFNIFEGKNIHMDQLLESIQNPQFVIYKNSQMEEKSNKKIIGVIGLSGVGKSVISSALSKDMCAKLRGKVLLADMSLKTHSLDIYNNISTNLSLYEYLSQCEESNFSRKEIEKYILEDQEEKKLNYLLADDHLGNLNEKMLDKIYQYMIDEYQHIVLDLDTNLNHLITKFWLEKVTDVVIVMNPNYVNVRNSIAYLKNLKKNSIKLSMIINKIQRGSLDFSQIRSFFKEYYITGYMMYSKNIEGYMNGSISNIVLNCNFDRLYKKIMLVDEKISLKESYLKKYMQIKKRLENV